MAAVLAFLLPPAALSAQQWGTELDNALYQVGESRSAFFKRVSHTQNPQIDQFQEELEELAQKVSPGVVQIVVKAKHPTIKPGEQFFQGPGFPPGSGRGEVYRGSGFMVRVDGELLIVTNAHVVDKAEGGKIKMFLKDNSEKTGTVLGFNLAYDLAFARLDRPCPLCAVLNMGNRDSVKVGSIVAAIGAPFNLRQSVAFGFVNAVGRSLEGEDILKDYIQSQVPINAGNSGGPLFDTDGNVVGVNSSIYSVRGGNVGVSFSIPIEHVKDLISRWRKYNVISSVRMGAGITENEKNEIEIDGVSPDSPAAKAGLEQGDVVLSIDGQAVPQGPQSAYDLAGIIVNKLPSQTMSLMVRRGGHPIVLNIVLEENLRVPEDD